MECPCLYCGTGRASVDAAERSCQNLDVLTDVVAALEKQCADANVEVVRFCGIQENPDIEDDVVRISFGGDGTLACNPPVNRDDLICVLQTALGKVEATCSQR